jgi:hypothetical protein
MKKFFTSILLFGVQLPAAGMDWQFRSTSLISVEGGLLSGTKTPLNSSAQREYDEESAKSGISKAAREKIKTLNLYGAEWYSGGTALAGYEGFSDNLQWQSTLDLRASAGLGNSTGRFYSPLFDTVFPAQGRAGRNGGWLAGGEAQLHWLPMNSFTAHLKSSFSSGSNQFKENFSRLTFQPEAELKAGSFIINPQYSFQRLLGGDALPAADIDAWALDIEWLGSRTFRFQNPKGYSLIKVSRAVAMGSAMLVTALENEGRFFEINLTPRIHFSGGLSFSSHLRLISGSEQSYIAPSLAAELRNRGKRQNDWTPVSASADYTSETVEWRNSLNQRMGDGWNLFGTLFYTSQSNAFSQTPTSSLRFSDLIDTAQESAFRYFLGSEFLL